MNKIRLGSLFAAVLLAVSLVHVDFADARRGGSFGSRGARTFQSAPATRTAPGIAPPVSRSMTPNSGVRQNDGFGQQGYGYQRRPGLFGGFGGGLLGGLLAGGLFGMLMGHGFGGIGGFGSMIFQILILAVGGFFLMRFLRGRSAAGVPGGQTTYSRSYEPDDTRPQGGSGFRIPTIGSGIGRGMAGGSGPATAGPSDEIGVGQRDLDAFEGMLEKVQAAFSREDHAALRRLTTPEMVSYLSEELADNATKGLKNDVTDVRLLQGDVAEAWREGERDYATVAMRYSSVDVMRDRATGKVVSGDPEQASETTELWTFLRDRGADWTLSAIQDAA